jgi:hypothetical protein
MSLEKPGRAREPFENETTSAFTLDLSLVDTRGQKLGNYTGPADELSWSHIPSITVKVDGYILTPFGNFGLEEGLVRAKEIIRIISDYVRYSKAIKLINTELAKSTETRKIAAANFRMGGSAGGLMRENQRMRELRVALSNAETLRRNAELKILPYKI